MFGLYSESDLIKINFLHIDKMSQQKPIFDYNDEGHVDRLSRKAKDAPFMMIGLFVNF